MKGAETQSVGLLTGGWSGLDVGLGLVLPNDGEWFGFDSTDWTGLGLARAGMY